MSATGISRKKRLSKKDGKEVISWAYFDSKGRQITDKKIINRCNKLALPPAWTDVWISLDAESDLQATGFDSKGRKQYRYHENWIKKQSIRKFENLKSFANTLPLIRKRVQNDLERNGMPRDKVVALIIRLMDLYHIRVGNDEYARNNDSYGLTTLQEGHMKIDRSDTAEGKLDAVLEFKGKSGKDWKLRIWEDDLATLIEKSGLVGGRSKSQDLFRSEDEKGKDYDIKSYHINDYLNSAVPGKIKPTAKEFRTWAATWKMASRLAEQVDPETKSARTKVANEVARTVASDLGNTLAVCKSSYIHPLILEDWQSGQFRERWNTLLATRKRKGLSKQETQVYNYLMKFSGDAE